MNKKRFFQNAFTLVVVTFLLRLVWTAFRVVMSNKVGAECMGLYQLTFAIYSISVTFATSGINFAATRLVAQAISTKKISCKGVMNRCIIYSLFFGTLSGLVVFFLSKPIGVSLLCDERTVLSLKAFAVSLPFISLCSAVSGYFYAVRNVTITLFARGLEQLVQIITFFAVLFFIPQKNTEFLCFACTFSAAASEIISSLFLYLAYNFYAKSEKRNKGEKIFEKIFKIALVSASGAYLKTGLGTVENILIPRGFKKYGASNKLALEGYGMLCSMVMPVLFFPSFVLSSFSMLLIPEFTESQILGKNREIQKTASLAVKLTLMFALFVSANFICFGKELGIILYASEKAGNMLKAMAPLVPFMYLDSIADGMLKGLGEYNRVLAYSSIDTLLSIALILFILPKMGLEGYIIVVYSSSMLNATLSIGRLLKITKNEIAFLSDIIAPFLMALASAFCANALGNLLLVNFEGIFKTTLIMIISALILIAVICLCGGNVYKTFNTALFQLIPKKQKMHFSSKKSIKIP